MEVERIYILLTKTAALALVVQDCGAFQSVSYLKFEFIADYFLIYVIISDIIKVQKIANFIKSISSFSFRLYYQ